MGKRKWSLVGLLSAMAGCLLPFVAFSQTPSASEASATEVEAAREWLEDRRSSHAELYEELQIHVRSGDTEQAYRVLSRLFQGASLGKDGEEYELRMARAREAAATAAQERKKEAEILAYLGPDTPDEAKREIEARASRVEARAIESEAVADRLAREAQSFADEAVKELWPLVFELIYLADT